MNDKVKELLDNALPSKWIEEARWRENNKEWLNESVKICTTILMFLRQNNMSKETLEQLCGFELDLHGSHDFRLSEIKKLELMMNEKLI